MPQQTNPVFTIGHGNATIQELLSLLRKDNIQLLIDVRSVPYSAHAPDTNRESIQRAARADGIEYIFMGDYLGGKPKDVEVRDELGNFDYSQLAATDKFREGMRRLVETAASYRVCLLCAEEDPCRCHRGLLISRELAKLGVEVRHIRVGGEVELQPDLEKRIPPVEKSLFAEIRR